MRDDDRPPARNDSLRWRASITFRAYGLTISIRTTHPSALHDIGRIFPYGSKACSDRRPDFLYSLQAAAASGRSVLWRNAEIIDSTRSRRRLLETLESSLAQTVAEFSRTDVFVHAGAVSWNGGAIIIPGRSLSGKSTLVAALVRAGAAYLSDEYAVIDSRGRVRPFARPLALRSERGGRQIPTSVESLRGRTETRPRPVSVVFVTTFKKDARFRPRPLSAGEVLLALLANTVPARTRPKAAMSRLRRVAASARGLRGSRGEAAAIAMRILSEADRKSVRQPHFAN